MIGRAGRFCVLASNQSKPPLPWVQAGESDLVSPVRYRLGGGREFPTDGSRLPDAGVGGDGGGDEGEEKEREKKREASGGCFFAAQDGTYLTISWPSMGIRYL